VARVDEALAQQPAVEATKRGPQARTRAKVSTTDPDARVMKLMDGGFRPAYNVQFATDGDSHAVVGVAVTNVGTDYGQLTPMLAQVEQRTGRRPTTYLADTGYVSIHAIQAMQAQDVVLYAPLPKGQNSPGVGVEGVRDAAVAAWRARMQTPEGQRYYRARAGTAERLNADAKHHRTLGQVGVRGLPKVLSWALWIGLAQNVMRAMAIVPHLLT